MLAADAQRAAVDAGRVGNAFRFDGVSGHGILVPNQYNFEATDFTIEGWINSSRDYTGDSGTIINPLVVEGQIHGGLTEG